MMIKYEIGASKLWKYFYLPLAKLLAVILIFLVISLIWFDTSRDNMFMVVILTLSWIGLIHVMPFLVLAIRHSRISKDTYFLVDTINITYHYKNVNNDIFFDPNQIEEVIKVVSPPKYDNRIDVLGFGHFFYWKIILTDGTILIMSCILLDIEDFFGKKYKMEKRMFSMPPIPTKSRASS